MTERKFHGLRLTLPDQWCDITEDLPPDSPPTLTRGENGVGVLQFSIARYKGGARPEFTLDVLSRLLAEFETKQGLSNKQNLLTAAEARPLVQADFKKGNDFVRVYYISDGTNLCLITYLCDETSSTLADESKEADRIVQSLRF